MDEQWTEIAEAVRSSDPDQVNDAIDQMKEMDRDQQRQLFDIGFDELASISFIHAEADTADNWLRSFAFAWNQLI